MATYKKGKMINFFTSPDFTKENGEVVAGKPKAQILEEIILKSGEKKSQLTEISIPKEKVALYKDKIGSTVEIEVGVVGKCSFYGI